MVGRDWIFISFPFLFSSSSSPFSWSVLGLFPSVDVVKFLLVTVVLCFQRMEEMRDCYDSLLSAAAATENSAYGKFFGSTNVLTYPVSVSPLLSLLSAA